MAEVKSTYTKGVYKKEGVILCFLLSEQHSYLVDGEKNFFEDVYSFPWSQERWDTWDKDGVTFDLPEEYLL